MTPLPAGKSTKRPIKLPQNSTRLQRQAGAHIKLIEAVRPISSTVCFEGRVMAPGALVPYEDLGARALVLECVGPVNEGNEGYHRRRQRPNLWILWQYDWGLENWKELGRASSVGAEWVETLKYLAMQVIQSETPLVDLISYWKKISETIKEGIDKQLVNEAPDVQISVLQDVYNFVAGGIARALAA